MKKHLKNKQNCITISHLVSNGKLLLVIFVFFFNLNSYAQQPICNNQTGTHGGFTYEYWKSRGNGCLELKPGGAFTIEWSNVGNLLARKSRRPGSFEQVVTYDVDFKPTPNTGRSFVSIYGWTQNPLIEYYIVENWSTNRPTKGQRLGTITSDGDQYDLYRTQRVNKPSIEGTKTFYQYWSIRRNKRSSGTVTTANHFNGWKDVGLNLGSLWEVSLVIEALRDSAGFAEVKSMSMTTGTGTNIIGPEGYTYAANESETVQISDIPYDVAYGQDGKYEFLLEQREDVACTNDAFGNDPASGVEKYCFVRESKLPFNDNATQIPGTIEAEHYDYGGAGRSYLDNESENRGDVGFREESGVDIDQGANGQGLVVGWMSKGEWLEYTVDVIQDGEYNFIFSTASPNGEGVLGIDLDGNELLSGLQTPQTAGWDVYSTFSTKAQLSKGTHVLRLNVEQNGFNLDKIEINANSLGITDFNNQLVRIHPNPSRSGVFSFSSSIPYEVYTIHGKEVLTGYSNQIDLSAFSDGIYLLKSNKGVVKLVK